MWWSSASCEPPHTRASGLACSPVRSRRQAWAGAARPVAICPRRPRFFFSFSYTLRHRFARPHATAGSTAAFYFQTHVFCMVKKKRCPTPRKSHLWFRTYFAKSDGKNVDLVKILSFSPKGKKQPPPLRRIAPLTRSHRGAPCFPSPSYVLRHFFARRHATAGPAAAFSFRAPRTQKHPRVDFTTIRSGRTRGLIAA